MPCMEIKGCSPTSRLLTAACVLAAALGTSLACCNSKDGGEADQCSDVCSKFVGLCGGDMAECYNYCESVLTLDQRVCVMNAAACDAAAVCIGVCLCDESLNCDPGCEYCDPDCGGCTCNVSAGCDPGCEYCDPDCGGCTCNVSGSCDSGCSCDPDCGGCTCNTSGSCDPGCSCDPDCCTPSCGGKTCGPDLCGGTCPPGCATGETCTDGVCVGQSCVPAGQSGCSIGRDCCFDSTMFITCDLASGMCCIPRGQSCQAADYCCPGSSCVDLGGYNYSCQ
jgi:hypothetical protein